LILQTLDIKNNCQGVFYNGQFIFDEYDDILENHNLAWKHSSLLDDEKYKYLYLLAKDEDLSLFSEDCDTFKNYTDKLRAHQRAALTAKVDLEEECFFDLIPEHQMSRWFHLRQSALKNLQKTREFGEDYPILHKAHVLTSNISQQQIQFKESLGKVTYNIFGSATGRLTTTRTSVPVLTMKKEDRRFLKPQNDAFVEMDLNAAEARTLLALSGISQPEQDIHEWLMKNVYKTEMTRPQAKVKLFSWLYNFSNSDIDLDKFFSRQIFRDFYCTEKSVLTTPYGRELQVDERKAQNYLLQSTTSDIVIENAYKIMKMLENKKTKIAFTLHDSIILDVCRSEAHILPDIKHEFESTRWGNFLTMCKIGVNFGELRELKI
jgi:hypothetical protein